ncbi:MAG: hypothetical protein JO081_07125 [Alphaproteobacteria bacterium]|nr:hypothetical protein [Alphaproteobacteria bacterium]
MTDDKAVAAANGSNKGALAPTASATASAEVFFEAIPRAGGSGGGIVHLVFTASGTTTAIGPEASIAFSEAFIPSGDFMACSASGATEVDACGVLPTSFDVTQAFAISADVLFDFGVITTGSAQCCGSFGATSDPNVGFDPAFNDAASYTLAFSADPPLSMSEPPVGSILIIGLAMLAAIRGLGRHSTSARPLLPGSSWHGATARGSPVM